MIHIKKNILFLVHTEYHMMVALSAIADLFDDEEKFAITIYQTENNKTNRFNFRSSVAKKPQVAYHKVKYDERDFNYNAELNKVVNTILNQPYDLFVLFNQHGFLPIYLAKELAKKGVEICLAPDGAKAYNNLRKIAPRWSLIAAINLQRFLYANKLNLKAIHIPTLTYADLKEIDYVWIQYPQCYINKSEKKIIKLDILKSCKAIEMINEFFQFDPQRELITREKVVFYINQPFRNQELYQFEIKLLEYLCKQFPEHTLIIKLHPLTDISQVEKMKVLPGVQIISRSYPAELYIAQLKDSIVLSFWSTACLINNEDVKIYWLHPALKRMNMMPGYLNLSAPGHILEVDSFEKITEK